MKKLVLEDKECVHCGKIFGRESCRKVADFKEKKYCSKICYLGSIKRERHPNWKGGFKTRPDGYIRDSATDRYVHRIVMENHLGRELLTAEHIHHIDGNPKNNSIENLFLVSNSQHRKIEATYAKRDKSGRFA